MGSNNGSIGPYGHLWNPLAQYLPPFALIDPLWLTLAPLFSYWPMSYSSTKIPLGQLWLPTLEPL